MMKKGFYRPEALEHYKQNQVPKVMPSFISSFKIFLFWFCSFLLIGGVGVLWLYSPYHEGQGSGVIRNIAASALPAYGLSKVGTGAQTIAIALLPGQFKTLLRTGSEVQVQPEGVKQSLTGKIERIDETTQTVDQARVLYHLSNQDLSKAPASVVVAFISFAPSQLKANYAGRSITANVKVRIPSVLSLFFANQKLPGIT
jgi:hypothetical protein